MDTLAFPFSFKSIDDGGVIEGIGAAYGNVDHGGDRLMPGVFAKALSDRSGRALPMLIHHDQRRPIGVWTEMAETSAGLHVKGRIVRDSNDGRDAYALAQGGALAGLSIGYRATREKQAGNVRELHEAQLHEVSLVAIPMNDRATVRSVKTIANIRDLEDLLRDEGGMSGRRAKAAATAAWKAINASDSDEEANAELTEILRQSAARIAAF
jgi:HK97 family phage prohead protease